MEQLEQRSVSEAATTPPEPSIQLAATAVGASRFNSGGLLGISLSAAFLHLADAVFQLCFHLRHTSGIALITVGALAALEDRTRLLDLLLQR
jgi:hypothetical protein